MPAARAPVDTDSSHVAHIYRAVHYGRSALSWYIGYALLGVLIAVVDDLVVGLLAGPAAEGTILSQAQINLESAPIVLGLFLLLPLAIGTVAQWRTYLRALVRDIPASSRWVVGVVRPVRRAFFLVVVALVASLALAAGLLGFAAWLSLEYAIGVYPLSTSTQNEVGVDGLANRTLNSSGLFGIPASTLPPPPKGLWGNLANTVSGFVRVGGAALSAAWTLATAAADYVDQHLPTWLKAAGAQLVARVAAAAHAVGQIIQSALRAFLQWVIAELKLLLQPVTGPIVAGMNTYASGVGAALVGGREPGPPCVTTGPGWWTNLSANLYPAAWLVTVVIAVAAGVLAGVSLGTSSILTNILVIILGAAVGVLLLPDLLGLFAPQFVFASEDLANTSARSQANSQDLWNALADDFGYFASGLGGTMTAMQLRTTTSGGIPGLQLVLSILAVVVGVVSKVLNSHAIAIAGFFLGLLAMAVDVIQFLKDRAKAAKSFTTTMDAVSLGLDSVGVITSTAELALG